MKKKITLALDGNTYVELEYDDSGNHWLKIGACGVEKYPEWEVHIELEETDIKKLPGLIKDYIKQAGI